MMEDIYILAAYRSPVGRLLGALSPLGAPLLASLIIKEGLKKSGIKPSSIDEVIMGNVVTAGVGQNPARQAALYAGLPDTVNAFTVNKVCASGMKAVALGAEAIMCGGAGVVLAGGMESMSNAPFLLRDMRKGRRHGDSRAVDSMLFDGLLDTYSLAHMGQLCELTAEKYRITRKEQDAFALLSHLKAGDATDKGLFKGEIIPVRFKTDGREVIIDGDETIRRETTPEKLKRLKPVFKDGGTITAGNSPGLNDGAAFLVLASEKRARAMKIRPLAKIIGYTSAHVEPRWYPVAPISSVKKLLEKTGLDLSEFDLIEENEAFAAQTLAVIKELKIDPSIVNVNGGAIALGHPIGASGARLLVALIHALRHRKKKLGLATLCLGGGGAMSMAVCTV